MLASVAMLGTAGAGPSGAPFMSRDEVVASASIASRMSWAPGLRMLRETPLETCSRKEVQAWRFPKRTGFTTASIPYFFLHTSKPTNERAPDA